MANKESTFMNMTLTLVVITLVAATLMSSVFGLTKEPIRLAELKKKNEAIALVIPGFTNEPSQEVQKLLADGDTLYFYTARKGDEILGTAVETFTNKGFSGNFKLMVGFDPSGTITDIAVISHAETPGLGNKMEIGKSDFHVQFQGKDPANFNMTVTKDRGEVDAITASTITSRAYCDAVQRAYNGLQKISK